MWLALTAVCSGSNTLMLTQKNSVPASPSVEIRMCSSTHAYYIPGMVCGPFMLMMRSKSLSFYWVLELIWLVLSFLGWRITLVCMSRCMSLERKTHEHGGYDSFNVCSHRLFWAIEHYCSLVDVFGKREYVANRTMYGPLTKTRVVRWLMYLENGSTWQAVLRTARWRKRRWYGGCVLVWGIRYVFVVGYGSREAELERINGCLQNLIFLLVWTYIY